MREAQEGNRSAFSKVLQAEEVSTVERKRLGYAQAQFGTFASQPRCRSYWREPIASCGRAGNGDCNGFDVPEMERANSSSKE